MAVVWIQERDCERRGALQPFDWSANYAGVVTESPITTQIAPLHCLLVPLVPLWCFSGVSSDWLVPLLLHLLTCEGGKDDDTIAELRKAGAYKHPERLATVSYHYCQLLLQMLLHPSASKYPVFLKSEVPKARLVALLPCHVTRRDTDYLVEFVDRGTTSNFII